MFYQSCSLKYEISYNAQELEKILGTSWMLPSELPFDPYLKLRACLEKNETIGKNSTVYCPTGIYIQLPNPNYRAEITTLSDLAYEKSLVVLDSPAIYDFTHRNEIYVMLRNLSNEEMYIHPGEFIAALSIKRVEITNLEPIRQIEPSTYTFGAQKWIQKLKDLAKGQQESTEYSRSDVKKYLDA
jgi:dUTPase